MPSSKRRSSGGRSTPSKPPLHATPDGALTSPQPTTLDNTPQTPDVKSIAANATNGVDDFGFKATVVSMEDGDGKGKAVIWMSAEAMLAAPVATGSLVSVSVIALGKSAGSTPGYFETLQELCNTCDGVEIPYSEVSGTFVAIAMAWPLKKLVRNEVRLSRALALSLGSLPLGSTISLKPLQVQSSTDDLVQGSTGHQELGGARPAIFYDCVHVSLLWCPPPGALLATGSIPEIPNFPSFCKDDFTGSLPSPWTPGQPELDHRSSWGRSVLASPVGRSPFPESPVCARTPLSGDKSERGNVYEKRNETQVWQNWASVRATFEQGREKANTLLETFAARWIAGRYLLPGNIVSVPLSGCQCIFLVTDTKSSAQTVHETSDFSEEKIVCSPSISDVDKTTKMKEVFVTSSSPLEVYLMGLNTAVTLLPPVPIDKSAAESVEGEVSSSAGEVVQEDISKGLEADVDRIEYSALGGLSMQIDKLKQHVELSLLHPEHLTRYGLQPVRGVLLHGPPGTGKSSLARAAACEAGVKLFTINGPEIVSEFYGESEASLRAVFASAAKETPSVLFIDELDALVPARKDGSEELGQRMVTTLLTLMDGGTKETLEGILVIAATNRIDAIDPALRRPGRFDVEIEIGVPSPLDRQGILQVLLRDMKHTLKQSDVQDLAATTHGFVGADLAALCNEAAMSALRQHVHHHDVKFQVGGLAQSFADLLISSDSSDLSKQLMRGSNNNQPPEHPITAEGKRSLLKVTLEDFQVAKTKVRPSAMREVALEVPKVRWSDIGGQDDVKQKLKEIVEWPQKQSDAIARMGVDPPHGVLLYGPPGCSKTLMARAVASETGLNFIAVKGPELFSKWVGESEKAVQTLFARARAAAPSVVFFDEIDGLAVKRESAHVDGVSVGDRVMSQLLTEMDGLVPMKGVSVIAATNRLDIIDDALLRPGRFDRVLYVGPPDEAARQQIFSIHLQHTPCGSDVSKSNLAARTVNYTGADISAVCQAAAMAALEEDLEAKVVKMSHFDIALARVQPRDSGS